MKTTRKILSVIVLLTMLILFVIPVQASSFDSTVLDGIVFIEVFFLDAYGDYWRGTGTGFFIGEKDKDPQYILTNAHVVENYLLYGGANGINEIWINYDRNDYEEGYFIEANFDMDLALLRIGRPTDKRRALPLRVIDDRSSQGDPVYAVGFPAIVEEQTNAKTAWGKNDTTVTSGIISRVMMQAHLGRVDIQIDATISWGNSGGPLVDDKGRVIGVNTWGFQDAAYENYNMAVSIEHAIPLIKRNNIDPWVVEPMSLTLILAIAGGAAGLILIIVLIILLARKKPAPVPVAVHAGVQSAPMQAPAGVGVGSGGATMPMMARSAIIKSMAAQHNNMTAPLGRAPVIIGRDSSVCKIVFKEDTPGVSSKHCQIYFDGDRNSIILTDLGSTYGTFLMNGMKLSPNIPTPLNPKDYFYLGSKDNIFTVDME